MLSESPPRDVSPTNLPSPPSRLKMTRDSKSSYPKQDLVAEVGASRDAVPRSLGIVGAGRGH